MYYTVKPLQKLAASNDNARAVADYTADELLVIRRMITGEYVTFDNSGLEKDEWSQLMKTLGR